MYKRKEMLNVHYMKIITDNFVKFQPRDHRNNGVIDPMQVDTPPEENDNNKKEQYDVDIDSFVRKNFILGKISIKHH